jgi:hypothetical protein
VAKKFRAKLVESGSRAYYANAGRGAADKVPQLWLYADNDRLYDEAQIREYYQAFTAAGIPVGAPPTTTSEPGEDGKGGVGTLTDRTRRRFHY